MSFTPQQLQTLEIPQLQPILIEMGLSTIGPKQTLIRRILDNQQFPPLDDRRRAVLQHITSAFNGKFDRRYFADDFLPHVQSYEQLVADQELQLRNMSDEDLKGVEGFIILLHNPVLAQAFAQEFELVFTGQESVMLSEGQPTLVILPQ